MDMNSSSSPQSHHPQNWLAFSLSNHHHFTSSSSDSSHLSSFFQPFHPNPPATTTTSEENGSGGCPKLEDFLGGGNVTSSSAAGEGVTDMCHQMPAAGEPAPSSTHVVNTDMYESELKTIAASFLRGYNSTTDRTDTQKQMTVPLSEPPPPPPAAKKAAETFGQRTSIYRGVTRHRWTGRYEAHLWDNTCRREGQSRKGRQVYLGGYDKEDKAARAYDLAALKYWGPTTTTNFPVCNYEKELEEMKHMTRQEFVASLRRRSSGFSRGASIYRGVTRHHQHGRWQARIGRVAGNKDLYLGTFSTQEEAAEAYDIAAIKFRGLNAVTNFDISRYDVKSIASSNLPIGGMNNKSKASSETLSGNDNKSVDGISNRSDDRDLSSVTSVSFVSQTSTSTLSFGLPVKQDASDFWSSLGYTSSAFNNGDVKNPIPGAVHVHPTTTTTYGVEYVTTSNNTCENNNVLLNGGNIGNDGSRGFFEEENNNGDATGAVVPIGTRIGSYGNWMHSFQSEKQNLSVFQTPIFGME